jgi:alkyl sulfatase BDS1-like metallo-beta-lactamase superfamily hydrolase
MAEIGSEVWIDAFNAALTGLDAGDAEVAVLHRIDGGPAWLVVAAGGTVSVQAAGPGEDADLTFTWQRADAGAVARGDISPLEPFQAGRLRIGGDLTRLAEVAGLFARFPAVPVG